MVKRILYNVTVVSVLVVSFVLTMMLFMVLVVLMEA